MTRAQRSAHRAVFQALAVFLLAALGFALYRRSVVAHTESASLGHAAVHDAPSGSGRP